MYIIHRIEFLRKRRLVMPAQGRIGDPFTCGDHIATGSPNVFVNGLPMARNGDATTGHGCWTPNKLIQGASTVFANNIPISYVGHKNAVHRCDDNHHQGAIAKASPNVFTE
jgi:uncharacterized Zn-binding protein involved in type VI secretion